MKIVIIPDTQVRKGVPLNHLECAGRYIIDEKPDVIVCIGDWEDMPSLSMFNSNLDKESLRIVDDINSAKEAMELFLKPIKEYNIEQKALKKKQYKPRMVFTDGNHSSKVRIERFESMHPETTGMMKPINWEDYGWEVYPFLTPVTIEGIRFCHYFQNPHSLKGGPISGGIDIMIKNAGFSFVQGHQQVLKIGKHYLGDGSVKIGIVAGAFYQHEETYMGKQANNHWRGIIKLDNVKDGNADISEIGMKTLLTKYSKNQNKRRK